MLNDPLGLSLPPVSGAAESIRQWIREAWQVDDDVSVIVCEAHCTEPGCPPTETVIAVKRADGTAFEKRLHKAMAEFTREDAYSLAEPAHQDAGS